MALERALKGGRVWWVAPTYKMGLIGWDMLKAFALQIPDADVQRSRMLIEFPGGGRFEVRSGDNPDTLRGEGLQLVILDECAFMDDSVWNAALRPSLAIGHGHALFISTPNGQNWFYRLYALGFDDLAPDWSCFNFQSTDNPFFPVDEMESAKRELPERIFRAEYMAEFLKDTGAVFRGVEQISTLGRADPTKRNLEHVFHMGIDWGRDYDFTVCSVVNSTTREQVDLLRFNQIGWQIQKQKVMDMYARWRPQIVSAEANAMGMMLEALQAEGLPIRPFHTSHISKPRLIETLALAIERQQIHLLADKTQIMEMQAYTYTRNQHGNFAYGAPYGYHDDCVIATALAVDAAMVAPFFIV
jgi:phage FluMu gp28-like protein